MTVAEITTREQHHGPSTRPFDPTRVSGSRLNSYVSCGTAFHRHYIEKIPEQKSGSAALFGNVFHSALEKWGLNRTQSLVTLVAQAWHDVAMDTPVAEFILAYQKLSLPAMRLEKEIRDDWPRTHKGAESKAPRMSKQWKESQIAKDISSLIRAWAPAINEGSPWRFTESDPLPSLYDESLILAKRYALRWKHLPPVLHSEFGFNVEWRGFHLTGYIDAIEPLFGEGGELERLLITDYKTYKQSPPEAKDWRAAVMYDIGLQSLREVGIFDVPDVPIIVCMDYCRLLERKYWTVGDEDRDKLAEELKMYQAGVTNGVFLPAEKNRNADFCPYPDNCCLKTRGPGTATPVEIDQG